MRVPCGVITCVPILLCLSSLSAAASAPCADADLIIRNAHVVTMDSARPLANAMAIRDSRILAVGSDPEIARCASERSKVVDLQKLTVLPGLIDVHTHALEWTKGILRGEIDVGYPTVHAISEITQEV